MLRTKPTPAAIAVRALIALMLFGALTSTSGVAGAEAGDDRRTATDRTDIRAGEDPETPKTDRPVEPAVSPATDVPPSGNCTEVFLGAGSPSPSQDILDWIQANYSNPGVRDFDQAGNDRYFAHTFNLNVPVGQAVVSGQLVVAATVGAGLGSNDSLRIGDFPNAPLGGGSLVSLGYPQQVASVQSFDLSALPSGGPTVDVLGVMTTTTQLDVVIQDDTMVDYLSLVYCIAPDIDCATIFIGAGSPTPSADLASWVASNYSIPGIRDFDVPGANSYFAHTFSLGVPAGYIVISGELEVGATVGPGLGSNDAIRAGDLPGGPSGGDQFLDLGFIQTVPGVATLDLATLPPTFSTASVLNAMTATGELDVTIQDDTMVDYLRLTYCWAPPRICFEDFAGTGSPMPSADVLDHIASNYTFPGTRDFDQAGLDRYFGHTFDLTIPATYSVVSGSLRVAATVGGGNDAVWMGDFPNNPFGGGNLMSLGYPWNTPHVETFDLNNLIRNSQPVSVLNAMTVTAELDVVVQDDTLVDYLDLEYCTSRKHTSLPHIDPQKAEETKEPPQRARP